MSLIIAEIYEIEKEIGSGGGGIVYLGRHLRLEKQVVLKADRRTLSTGNEALRREVDMLKGLSHTYIPQVYDFVAQDGIVYTVMDFIEGESLDRLLGRAQLPSQPQVIKWACQLLEALSYLHGRPPHGILHGDIKPANIMLRPNGDICLIDFNIALALGEDGAVKAGFSRGYASPEHYGAEYIGGLRQQAAEQPVNVNSSKQPDITEKTLSDEDMEKTYTDAKSATKGRQVMMLDVRSDIYSLGATLYHLLSGRRPAQNVFEVKPLEADVCSPAISVIIQKAMAVEPDLRYQSAEEMLTAFLQLYKCDKRIIRHKRHIALSAAILTSLFLFGGACTFVGLKQLEQRQTALTLAEYSANALNRGDVSEAVSQAMQAIPSNNNFLEAPVTAQAQKALTDALGVYDLSDGFKALDAVKLPSAPFCIEASPKGSCFAVVYAFEAAVFDTEQQQKIVTLPMQTSALSDCVFVDETHIIYAGSQGVTAYDLNTQEILWTGEAATTLSVSADRTVAAAVNRDENNAVIYRVSDGAIITECSFDGQHLPVAANDIFADPQDSIFALSRDGSMLAVSFSNGGLTIFNLKEADKDIIIYDKSDYRHFEGGFYNKYFAFTAQKSDSSLFALTDTEQAVLAGSYESQNKLMLQTDERGIYLADSNLLVSLTLGQDNQKVTGRTGDLVEKELAYTGNVNITAFSVGEEYVLTATDDNCFSFYDSGANLLSVERGNENYDFVVLMQNYAVTGNRNEPSVRLMKLENHSEAQLLSYDARYAHDEARISRDGRTIMLFNYINFRIYDKGGNILTQVELPDAEYIYDQQFVKNEEGSWLEVSWYDGTIRRYSAADGSLIFEETGEAPPKDLYEEFFTNEYRIASSLHTAPEVYDLKTGRLIATLEEDSYLTYVTQTGEYIITEYISAAGERYGLLLDSKLQKLACLPGLCDVLGDMLVFDYESGNLRQCRLYSLQELTALGETYLINQKGEF